MQVQGPKAGKKENAQNSKRKEKEDLGAKKSKKRRSCISEEAKTAFRGGPDTEDNYEPRRADLSVHATRRLKKGRHLVVTRGKLHRIRTETSSAEVLS